MHEDFHDHYLNHFSGVFQNDEQKDSALKVFIVYVDVLPHETIRSYMHKTSNKPIAIM